MAVERAASLMLGAGIPEAALSKLFAGDNSLAKAAPGQDPTQDPGQDPSMDDGQDPSQDGSADGDDPLDVLGRLLAASMIQLDHIQQMIAGGGTDPSQGNASPDDEQQEDPTQPDPDDTDPSQDVAPSAVPPKPVAKLESPEEVALAKRAADLEEKLAGTQELLKKALATPLAAKGMIRANSGLSKSADGGGAEDELTKFADELDAATTPEARSLLLNKAAFKFPGIDLRPFALSK